MFCKHLSLRFAVPAFLSKLLWVYQTLILSYAVLRQFTNKLFQCRLETSLEQKIPLQTNAAPPRPPKIWKYCHKPFTQECQVSQQAYN